MISTSSKGGSKDELKEKKNDFYVRVSPIPQLIYTNLAQNYSICLGSQAWIRVPLKTRIFIKN